MKEKNDLLLIVLIVILLAVIGLNVYSFFKIPEIVGVREFNASIIVSNITGFDLNPDILTFGGVLRGSSSSRQVNFVNDYGFPVELRIFGSDGMERFVLPFNEKFSVGETRTIFISAYVPLDIKFGEYSGKVVIKIKKDI